MNRIRLICPRSSLPSISPAKKKKKRRGASRGHDGESNRPIGGAVLLKDAVGFAADQLSRERAQTDRACRMSHLPSKPGGMRTAAAAFVCAPTARASCQPCSWRRLALLRNPLQRREVADPPWPAAAAGLRARSDAHRRRRSAAARGVLPRSGDDRRRDTLAWAIPVSSRNRSAARRLLPPPSASSPEPSRRRAPWKTLAARRVGPASEGRLDAMLPRDFGGSRRRLHSCYAARLAEGARS